MSKVQIFKLAGELGMENKALIDRIKNERLDLPDKLSAITWLPEETADRIREFIKKDEMSQGEVKTRDAQEVQKSLKPEQKIEPKQPIPSQQKHEKEPKQEKEAHKKTHTHEIKKDGLTQESQNTAQKQGHKEQRAERKEERLKNIKLGWSSDDGDRLSNHRRKQNRFEVEEQESESLKNAKKEKFEKNKSEFEKHRPETQNLESERKENVPSKKDKKKEKQKHKSKQENLHEQMTGAEFTQSRHQEKSKRSKKKWHQKTQEVEEEVKVEAIILDERMTVADFTKAIGKKNNEVILKLMNLGVMAAVNQYIDFDVMTIVADDFGIQVEKKAEEIDLDILEYDFEDDEKSLVKRAPVVTVMGHVDHGKTSLLDAIRSTNVISGEAGGITQHIGASEVRINGEKIVFLDTPGHEAFTSLRARGAKVTDIAILVVSADDGVMPQTIEAIDHARAANVPIIVAINKIDKPTADPDRVIQELSQHGVLVEDWGGETVCVKVSAKKKQNIDQLLEMILIVAELQELKANPNRNAVGTVIEANLDKGRGAVATILIQNGTLEVGDAFVCGTTVGRVRAMYDFRGKKLKKAGPSSAVEIIGMSEVATAGDRFFKIDSDREARQIAEKRMAQAKRKEMEKQAQSVTLEDIFNQIQAGKVKTLDLILKADAHGSIEAIKQSLAKIETDEVKINIHHANVGGITENDIMLATASRTVIIGFNVRPSADVMAVAKKEGVEIRTYQIIYNLLDDIEAAMKGMLEPVYEEVQTAEVEIRTTFKVPGVGTIAGAYVKSGKIERNASIRLLRDGIIVHTGKLSSLKRFKDDVKEVASGYECGMGIENYSNIKEGDIIEAFEQREIPRK